MAHWGELKGRLLSDIEYPKGVKELTCSEQINMSLDPSRGKD